MSEYNMDTKNIPNHVGLIMDGNRRWAKANHKTGLEGHYRGYEKLTNCADWFFSRGVKFLSVFAFSTENWDRAKEEVDYLMNLLKRAITEQTGVALKKGYRLMISGRTHELPGNLPDACRVAMEKTKTGLNGTLNICLNYGGQPEITDAVKRIITDGVPATQITEAKIGEYLYNPAIPDLDMVVRTSGEQRSSGFMLWRAHYAEFLFLQKHWPDFDESDVEFILAEYAKRQRRFGGD